MRNVAIACAANARPAGQPSVGAAAGTGCFLFFHGSVVLKGEGGQPLRLFAGTIFDRKTFFFLKTRPIYEIAMNLTFFLLKSVEKFDIMISVENLVFVNKNSK